MSKVIVDAEKESKYIHMHFVLKLDIEIGYCQKSVKKPYKSLRMEFRYSMIKVTCVKKQAKYIQTFSC